ncbi:hypothetical protein [Catenovulum maritimum]|nr:hypothetical protein [Catenovulum maritimum]
MSKFKLHLWFVINLSACLYCYNFPETNSQLIQLVFFLSPLILMTKKEIKYEYAERSIPRYMVFIVLGAILAWVFYLFNKSRNLHVETLNEIDISNNGYLYLAGIITFVYLFRLFEKEKIET